MRVMTAFAINDRRVNVDMSIGKYFAFHVMAFGAEGLHRLDDQ
jgi:hypothetical protein